jgi:membrane-associated phospholipid phosphatase
MTDVLQFLVSVDEDAIRVTRALRWEPATAVLALASAWWVKGPLLVATGWCADIRHRRRLPVVALAATASFLIASWFNYMIKALVDRSRPPEAIGLDALVGVPGSPSFPSGHAMTAFATAGALAILVPRLRLPVLALAAVIAFSRVYLGVHFWLDVMVGAVLGLLVALAVCAPLRRSARGRQGDGGRLERGRGRSWPRRQQSRRSDHRDGEEPDLPAGDRAHDDVEREVRAEGDARDRNDGDVRQQREPQPGRHGRGGDGERRGDDEMAGRERWDVRPVAGVAAHDLGAQRLLGSWPVHAELDDFEHEVSEHAGEGHRENGAAREAHPA